MCQYCETGSPHPGFAFLVCDKRRFEQESSSSRHFSQWDYSRQPLLKLRQHNGDKTLAPGPKSTKSGAGNYVALLTVEGFKPKTGQQCAFVRTLRAGCRNFLNRLVRGVLLAQAWHTWVVPGSEPLKLVWDPDYREQAEALLQAAPSAQSRAQLVALVTAAREQL